MQVVRSTEPEDIARVSKWLVARGRKPWPPEILTGVGFAVDDVACIWLYVTGTPIALLEHLAANPDAPPALRCEAIDAVVTAALDVARGIGARYVYSVSTLPAVAAHARRHGFVAIDGATLLVADLSQCA